MAASSPPPNNSITVYAALAHRYDTPSQKKMMVICNHHYCCHHHLSDRHYRPLRGAASSSSSWASGRSILIFFNGGGCGGVWCSWLGGFYKNLNKRTTKETPILHVSCRFAAQHTCSTHTERWIQNKRRRSVAFLTGATDCSERLSFQLLWTEVHKQKQNLRNDFW